MNMMRGTKMMRSTWLCFLLVLLAVSTPQAQTTIDVAKITCDQFVTLQVATPDDIAIWLSGYYHGKRGSTIIDVQKLKEQSQKVMSYCLYTDKRGTVMEAVEKLHSSGE
jgi:acid stress chaperone HdeB